MFAALISRLRSAQTLRLIRPWALCAPVLVFLVAIPLLRPLRHPDVQSMSEDEQGILATVQAIVEQKTLAINHTLFSGMGHRVQVGHQIFSDQPPVFAAILSGPYWVLHSMGLTFERNPLWVMFLLTLIGVTIPVALSAGLVYKMGRMFELKRKWRTGLAIVVVFGSGLISYSTVLNRHAPAAALLLGAAGCLFYVSLINRAGKAAGWQALAGFCAALAATIDPPAIIFCLLFVLVVGAFRWPLLARAGAIFMYLVGASIPLSLHTSLNRQITGDAIPGMFHPDLVSAPPGVITPARTPLLTAQSTGAIPPVVDDDDEDATGPLHSLWRNVARLTSAFFGAHGIFSHFPVVLVGILGVSMVMHRHWPVTTKMLASVTLAGGGAIVVYFALSNVEWRDAMFATRWFVLFLPLTLFWSGAWLRRQHRTRSWVLAGAALAFSVTVSILGATGPLPPDGFDRYTALGAAQNLVNPPSPAAPGTFVAGR